MPLLPINWINTLSKRVQSLSDYISDMSFMYDFADLTIDSDGFITDVFNISDPADYIEDSSGDTRQGLSCGRFNNNGYLRGISLDQHDVGTNDVYIILQFMMRPYVENATAGFIELGDVESFRVQYRADTDRIYVWANDGSGNQFVYYIFSAAGGLRDGVLHILEVIWIRPNNPTFYVDGVELSELGTIAFTSSDDITPDTVTAVGSLGSTGSTFFGYYSFWGMNFSIPSESVRDGLNSILNSRNLSTWKTNTFLTVPLTNHASAFTAIVGIEFKLYKDSFINQPLGIYVTAEFDCSVGATVSGNFVYTPLIGDVGDYDLIITIKDSNGIIIDAERAQVSVIAGENGTGTKQILMIGDSTTAGKVINYDATITPNLDHLTIEYVGSLTDGDGYKHNGYSGKTFNWMVDHADSPFTKAGVLDITAYFTDNAVPTPDYIHIMLGINDAFQAFVDIPTFTEFQNWIADIDELVDGFLAYDAGIEIILSLCITAEGSGEGWENSYGDTRDSTLYMHKMMYMRQYMAARYDYFNYNARVHVIYSGNFVDRLEDYDGSNAVHPLAIGYNHIGNPISFEIERLLVP